MCFDNIAMRVKILQSCSETCNMNKSRINYLDYTRNLANYIRRLHQIDHIKLMWNNINALWDPGVLVFLSKIPLVLQFIISDLRLRRIV